MAKTYTREEIVKATINDASKVAKKAKNRLTANGCNVGEIEVYEIVKLEGSPNTPRVVITIESDAGSIAQTIIEALGNERLKVINYQDFTGVYDWRSDVYHKPYGEVILQRH